MKTRYILTVLISLTIFFIWSCEKDLYFNEVIQEEAQLNLRGFTSANLSLPISGWKEAEISATNKREHDANVVVGPDGTAHFTFWKETKSERINGSWYPVGYDIYYANTEGGTMSEPVRLTQYETPWVGYPGIAVDLDNVVHIVFQIKHSNGCGLYYMTNSTGSFQLVQGPYWDDAFGICSEMPGGGNFKSQIDVDDGGYIHLVNDFFYATNKNGNFEFMDINTSGLDQYRNLNIDEKDGNVHLVFSANTQTTPDNYDIYYEILEGPPGSFSDPIWIADGGDDRFPGVRIDNDGFLHIVHASGYEIGIYYTNNLSGSFTTELVRGTGYFPPDFELLPNNAIGLQMSYLSDGILFVHNSDGSFEEEVVVPPGNGQCACYSSWIAADDNGIVHMTNVRSTTVGNRGRQTTNQDVVYHTNDPNFQSGGGIMHVDTIDMELKQKGPNWNAVARVLVLDGDSNPVSGATVTGDWSGIVTGTVSSITEADGYATINSPKTKESGTFTFTVANVTKDGYAYDPNGEIENSISN